MPLSSGQDLPCRIDPEVADLCVQCLKIPQLLAALYTVRVVDADLPVFEPDKYDKVACGSKIPAGREDPGQPGRKKSSPAGTEQDEDKIYYKYKR